MAQQATPVGLRPESGSVRVRAHKVHAGMVVSIKGEEGTWTVLARHPIGGHWWVHRWTDQDEWQTSHAHYGHMEQVIDNGN